MNQSWIFFFLLCLPLLLLIFNLLFRFSDNENLWLYCLGVYSLHILYAGNAWSLLAFIAFSCPFPAFYRCRNIFDQIFDYLPTLKPDPFELTRQLDIGLSSCKVGDKIYFAFPDPQRRYENVFWGMKNLVDAVFVSAIKKRLCLVPNYWSFLLDSSNSNVDYFFGESDSLVEKCNHFGASWLLLPDNAQVTAQPDLKHFKLRTVIPVTQSNFKMSKIMRYRMSDLRLYEKV